MKCDDIQERLLGKGLVFKRYNEYYSSYQNSIEVANTLINADCAIIGIEGVYIREDSIYPDLDLICDFSSILQKDNWKTILEGSLRDSTNFLKSIKETKDIYFIFTCFSQDEWRKPNPKR